MTVVDRATRWPEAFPLAGSMAPEAINAFLAGWVSRYGVPRTIVSDQGPQFPSALWAGVCRRMGADHHLTPAYHPARHGLVERWHKDLKRALATRLAGYREWADELHLAMLQLRTAIREDTAASPAHVVFGADLRIPGALVEDAPAPVPLLEQMAAAYFSRARTPFRDTTYQRPAGTRPADYGSGWAYIGKPGKSGQQPVYPGPFQIVHETDTTLTIICDGGRLYYPKTWAKPAPTLGDSGRELRTPGLRRGGRPWWLRRGRVRRRRAQGGAELRLIAQTG